MSIEGVFAIAYGGHIGLGLAVIKVTDGQVLGHDFVGSKYHGYGRRGRLRFNRF